MSVIRILASAGPGLSLLASAGRAEEQKFANVSAPTHPHVAGTYEPITVKTVVDALKVQ
jgi:hypothetical protein